MTSHLDGAVQAFGEAIGKLLSVSTIAVIVQPDLATAARSLIEDPNCSEDADWIPAVAAAAVKLLTVMQREGVDAQELGSTTAGTADRRERRGHAALGHHHQAVPEIARPREGATAMLGEEAPDRN